MRSRQIGALMMLLIAANARPVPGQELRGTVRDSANRLPVLGAVVLLLDSLGRTLDRTTTGRGGEYRLPASSDGSRLKVLRLGFRPAEQPSLAPRSDASTEILLASIPSLLTPMRVTAAASCPSRKDRAAALTLLEQLRAGLLSAVVTYSQSGATTTRLLFERRFDGASDRIVSQTVRVGTSVANGPPFGAARSAAVFVREGFREQGAGGQTYYGPDAETLLDDVFTAGYCFRIVEAERGRPGQVGLGFEAADRRDDRVDVSGVLWLDTLARALRDLEFRYVGLGREVSALRPGGRLSFQEMPNGAVLIDRWSLRLVSGSQELGGGMLTSTGQVTGGRTSTLYAQETGGELARIGWPDGETWSAHLGRLRLHVVSERGRPAVGAAVRLTDTHYRGRTDSTGTLLIQDVLPGPYAVTFDDPRLAELGLSTGGTARVVATRDSTLEARVTVETAEELARKRCERDRPITGGAWVLGRVVDREGRPVKNARWTIRDEFGSELVEGGRVGDDGVFHWCQLPLGKRIEVEAWRDRLHAKTMRVLSDRLTTLRLELPQS